MRLGNILKNYALATSVGVLSLTSACSSTQIKPTPPIKYYQQTPETVLLIDMQPGFLETLNADEVERELPNMVRIVRYCAQQDIPMIIIEQELPARERTIDALAREIEKVPRHRYITKQTSDGFYGTQLAQQLNEWDATYIFLMGAHASRCVLDTAAGAWKRDIKTSTSRSVILNPAVFKDSDESVRAYIEMGLYDDDYQVFFSPVLKK